jgi:nanoRNase/pAp phosphatase (c-di-AMP/oligoRNAs hydrolase)
MPLFFKYLRDRDLWQWQLLYSHEVNLNLWSHPRTFKRWDVLSMEMDIEELREQFIAEGRAIERYADTLVAQQVKMVQWRTIGGHYVPVVNATTLVSEVGNELCVAHRDVPFAAYYSDRADGKRQWGLRGQGNMDLSVIAKQYGGGGHHDAAGFVTDTTWYGDRETEEHSDD